MTKKTLPAPLPLTHDERTAKFAELAQNAADLLTCGSALQKVGRNERAFATIEEARKCITALAAEYPSDTTTSIFTGPPKKPAARSHKKSPVTTATSAQ
jgi:hypothetical protein